MSEYTDYNEYTKIITGLYDDYCEVIYMCNNFDIYRIHAFFINIIENYNYHIDDIDYSDTNDEDELSKKIIDDTEYEEMKLYIESNFEQIRKKCKLMEDNTNTLITRFLSSNDVDKDDEKNLGNEDKVNEKVKNSLIIESFKNQYKALKFYFADLQRELGKIKKLEEKKIKNANKNEVKFNVKLLTKSNTICELGLYDRYKIFFKNAHIINSSATEYTVLEEVEINEDFNRIYKNLVLRFNEFIGTEEENFKNTIKFLANLEIILKKTFKEMGGLSAGGADGDEVKKDVTKVNDQEGEPPREGEPDGGEKEKKTPVEGGPVEGGPRGEPSAKPEEEGEKGKEEKETPEVQGAVHVLEFHKTRTPFKYSFDIATTQFTPVYNKKNEPYYLDKEKNKQATIMASLNAGHQNLRVEGGSTINGAFNRAITKKKNIQESENLDDDLLGIKFIEMHISCYMNYYEILNNSNNFECPTIVSNNEQYVKTVIVPILQGMNAKYKKENNAGKFYHFDKLIENSYISAMYLYISEERLDNFQFNDNGTFLYPGDVFIDILKLPPHDYAPNKAMIYCTGPAAVYTNTAITFYNAVEIVGKNIANAITEYNKIRNKEKIDYVRICLISGGMFAGSYDKVEIAKALIKGIHSVNKEKGVEDIVYNFPDTNLKRAFDILKNTYTELQSAELITT